MVFLKHCGLMTDLGLMSNLGSSVKAIRKAFTHLTEEPQFMAYMTKRDVKPLVILLIHEEGGCVHN